ncbi:MAG TPA: hypothetical protein VK607_15215 [Kofleriaceae bacterium]|nr:hypothetical protein [Kofleriaceae bacterium]
MLVGVNLLREGLDIPEVSLVGIGSKLDVTPDQRDAKLTETSTCSSAGGLDVRCQTTPRTSVMTLCCA